ncbi:MAG TPA: polyketide synthase, partial [Polyangiaceae bacterium]
MAGKPLDDASSDIAVVGMAARFPGVDGIDQMWDLLRQGAEGLTHFQESELRAAGERPNLLSHADYVKVRGVMAGADLFDAGFFDFSPVEAEYTDPQHRIFLEYCCTALQVAGYDPARFAGLIGVYAGAANSSYLQSNVLPHVDCTSTSKCMQLLAGNDKDFLATRVSYKLNLKGPSYTVQSACSTSLVAIHLACQALISGECDLALAGGVTIRVPQARGYLYEEGGLVSKDGHVRPFDASATGTVPGDGVGVVVLKLLHDAITDGDTIHAVVKGTATNNDGSGKANYAAPGKAGQAAVIREALAVSRVPAESIGYVEAQGSATKLGDTLEVAALTEAFRKHTQARGFCALGSVKSNFGALDAAAGVASFLKATLMLQRRAFVPTANYSQPNPAIDFASSPFYVSADYRAWDQGAWPRRAA